LVGKAVLVAFKAAAEVAAAGLVHLVVTVAALS
jgi:hypothetical protein